MWDYHYRDQKRDDPLVKEEREVGKGIIGCEMHERNGFGLSHHHKKYTSPGVLRALCRFFFPFFFTKESK